MTPNSVLKPSKFQYIPLIGVLALYLVLIFFGDMFLSQKFSVDSAQIVDLIETGPEGQGSYSATARLFGLVPEALLIPLIALIGCAMIMLLFGSAESNKAKILMGMLLVPVLLLDLMRPQKEVIVVIVTFCVAGITLLGPRNRHWMWVSMVAFVGFYTLYGLGVRPYFLLMIPAFFGIHLLINMPPSFRIFAILGGMLVIAAIVPNDVFYEIQGARDKVNMYRTFGTEGNLTFFFNPWTPDNAAAFFVNYIYAFIRLNIPILFHFTPQAYFLFATILTYIWFAKYGYNLGDWRTRMLTSIFLAHASVLILFEPDLGSYLRHQSSALIYLWPAFVIWQKAQTGTVSDYHPVFKLLSQKLLMRG